MMHYILLLLFEYHFHTHLIEKQIVVTIFFKQSQPGHTYINLLMIHAKCKKINSLRDELTKVYNNHMDHDHSTFYVICTPSYKH